AANPVVELNPVAIAGEKPVESEPSVVITPEWQREDYELQAILDSTPDSDPDYGDGDNDDPSQEEERFSHIADILEGVTISLDDSQIAAVRGLANEQVGCLIGAAGTGKTTVTRFLLHALINGDEANGIQP